MVLKDIQAKSIITGNTEIDRVLGRGLPSGSLTLLEGPAESGKSLLSQHFVHRTLTARLGVAYYTSEGNVKTVLSQMSSLDLDVTDYFLIDRLRVYALNLQGKVETEPSFDTLLEHIGELPDEIRLVVLDSLTSLFTRNDEDTIADFLEGCKQFCGTGRTLLVTVRNESLDNDKRERLRVICNAYLNLQSEETGEKTIMVLEVNKIRNTEPTSANIIGFVVEPFQGITAIPYTRKKE